MSYLSFGARQKMKQETITGVQKVTGWLFVGSGPLAWVSQNATVLTALTTVITGIIFATCAILNMLTNRKNAKTNRINAEANELRNQINERDIRDKILKEMDEELQSSLQDK